MSLSRCRTRNSHAFHALTLVLLLLGIGSVPAAANTVQWFNAVSGNWDDATKWYDVQLATTHVPTAADDVQIVAVGNYTVTVDTSLSSTAAVAGSLTFGSNSGSADTQTLVVAKSLSVGTTATSVFRKEGTVSIQGGSATLSGTVNVTSGTVALQSGTLTVDGTTTFSAGGTLNWSAGTLNGSGILATAPAGGPAAGVINILTTATRTFSALRIDNGGTTTWLAGQIQTGNGAIFNNLSTGTFDAQGNDSLLYNIGGAVPTFNNGGTFTKSGGTATTSIGLGFNNLAGATLSVPTGTVQLSGGGTIDASTITVAGAALLEFAGSGTTNFNTGASVTGPAQLTSGTLRFASGTTTFNKLVMAAGTIDGSGTLAITSSMDWNGGSMQGTGNVDIGSSASMNIATATSKTLDTRTMNNSGIVNFSGGQINSGSGAVVNNLPGATWDIVADVNLLYNTGGTQTTFNNGGTVIKSGGPGTASIGALFNFESGASLTSTSGTLSLTGSGTFASNSVASGGVIDFNGGTYTMNSGSDLSGPTTLTSGTLFISAAVTTPVDSFDMNGGVLDGPGILSVASMMNWNAGTFQGTGSVDVQPFLGDFNVATGATKTLSARTINNNGTTTWSGGQINSGSGAVFNNLSGATVDLQTDSGWFYNLGGAATTFNNSGAVTKSAGPGTTQLAITYAQSGGSTTVMSGTLYLSGGGSSSGGSFNAQAGNVLQLNGTHTFDVSTTIVAAGTIDIPGGTTTVAGTYNVSNLTSVTGGRLDLNANATSSIVDLVSGALGGTGTLTAATFNWKGGTTDGGGTTDVSTALAIATAATKTYGARTINNATAATWSAGQINSGNGAVFNNVTGATFDIQGDDGWFYNIGGAPTAINNAGTVTKSAATGTTNIGVTYDQTGGSTTAASGTLSLSGGGTHTGGTFDALSGSILQFNGTHSMSAAVTITAAGTISVPGGTTTIAGTYNVSNLTSVTGGRLDLNTGATSSSFTLASGALGGTGTLSSATFDWQSGTMDGSGSTDVSTLLTFSTGGTKTFSQRTINNASSAVWSGGQINSGNGAVFNNLAGSFDIQIDAGWFHNLGGTLPVFNNGGTLTKTAGTGTSQIGINYLQSGGSTTSLSGTLYLSGGGTSTGGSFDATAGNILQLNGTHTLGASTSVTGTGTILISGGTTTVGGTYNVSNLTQISGGRLDVNVSAFSGIVELLSGALGGTGTLSANTFDWQSGTMDGSGTTDVASTLTFTTAGTKTFAQRTLTNHGTATWSAGQINSGSAAVFNNLGGATFGAQGNDGWFHNLGGSVPTFNNNGTVIKSAGTGTSQLGVNLLQSGGSTSAGSGTLLLAGSGVFTGGTLGAASGSVLQFNGPYSLAAATATTAAGTISVIGGTTTANGAYNVANATTINGGRLDFNASASSSVVNLLSGALGGTGSLSAATFNWQGGTMDGSGSTNVSSALALTTTATKTHNARTINNSGAATWSAGQINSGSGAVFNNLAGATLDIQGDDAYFFNTGGTASIFNNAGTLKKSAGAASSTIGFQCNNSGAVQALAGTLAITSFTQTAGTTTLGGGNLAFSAGATLSGGILNGTGTITGSISNGAQVNPGTSPGMISISGNYTQTAAGVLNIELAGLTAGTQFDQLNVSGTTSLAGTLNVSLISPYSPLDGDAYPILTFGSVSGDFATKNGLNLGGNRQLLPNYSATSLTLATSGSQVNDAALDFSAITNPNGVWSYGWTPTVGGAFTLLDTPFNNGGADVWSRSGAEPTVFHNPTTSPISLATLTLPAGKLGMHPGASGEDSVVRWTAPSSGAVRINGFFNGIDYSYPTTTDVSILRNGASVFIGNIASYNTPLNFSVPLSLNAGDKIDFVVGYGANGNYLGDATQLEAAINAVGTADLSLTKTDSADPVIVGTSFTYTVTASNAGPSSATTVVVTDTLPAGLTFISATPSQGTCSGTTTITCNLGTIASAANATIAIVVQGTTVTTVTNTASATLNDFDPNTANNTASQSTTINPVPQADLSLTMTDAPDPVNAGSTVSYTITANNAGPGAASSVVVTDVLPAGTTFVSATGTGWNCNNSAGTVTCSAPSLGVGSAPPITLQLTAPSSGASVSNTASVSSATTDPVSTNNSATATTSINAVADLAVLKSGPASANAGTTITWTITPKNFGPSVASSVSVVDTLPAGTTFVSATGTGWSCSASSGTVTCTTASMVVGIGNAITLQATAPASGGSITNSVSISGATTDPSPGNNSATATTNVASVADLSTAISDSPDPVVAGGTLNYTITVTNLGPSASPSATVTDTLPAGTAFVSASGSGWTCSFSSGTVTCTRGSLPAGAAPAITLSVTAPSTGGSITNTATVALLTSDPNSGNNSASATTTVVTTAPSSDLGVTVSGPASASVGEAIAYTIVVSNDGPAPAPNVTINVSFTANLHFDSKSGAGSICSRIDAQRFQCSISTLAANSNASLVFNMTPTDSGAAQFSVSAASGNADPNTSDNRASVSTDVAAASQPDLVLTKSASTGSVPGGESFTYTFAVANNGNAAATSLVLTDPIPAGVDLLATHGGDWACTFSSGLLTCTLPALAPGASSSFTIDVGAPTQPGQVTNVASVSEAETDANLSNNSASVTTAIGCPTFVEIPLLSAPRTINSGQHYTITLNEVVHAAQYEIQESADEAFTNPTTISTDELSIEFSHEVVAVTRYYYRARVAQTDCGASGPFSDPIPVTIEPFSASNPNPSIAVEFGSDDPVEQTIFVAQPLTGETHFDATTDRLWMTVSPSSGPIGPAGVFLIVTADPSQLEVGTNTGTVLLSFSNTSKQSPSASPPPTNSIPVSVSLVTPVIMQPPTEPSSETLIIPAVAHVDTPNARWQSDVRLTNAGSSKLRYVLSFTSSGNDVPPTLPETTIEVKPGQSVALNDIVRNWFGLGSLADGAAGVLKIRPVDASGKMSPRDLSVATVAASRTFSIDSKGTMGQFVPAIRFASFIGSPAGASRPVLNLQQIAQSSLFRTNLGLVEGSGHPASVLLRVFDPAGASLASIPVSLKANEHMQINSFLEKNNISLADGRIEVQVTSPTGRIMTYASVVDNGTNDPLFEAGIPLGAEAASDYLIGGVGDFSNEVNHWRTDMRVFNPTSGAVTATMTYYPERSPQTAQSKQISLAPGEVRAFDNILEAVFGVKNSVGVIRVAPSVAAPIVATARTYDKQEAGTLGQFVPAVTQQQSVGTGDRALQILQVEESDRFRTNLGIFEVTGKPAKVEVGIIAPELTAAATYTVDLQGYEFRNLGSLMKVIGLPAAYNGRLTVRVIEGEGRVSAYGSVVDVRTQDPTYVPAQ